MSLFMPKYILDADISDVSLKYKWDDWKLIDIFETEDDAVEKEMASLSYRASAAFTIACGEWIVHRFDAVSNDPIPIEHMEACWAGLIDLRYLLVWEPSDEDWLGPVRGGLSLAIIMTLHALNNVHNYISAAEPADHASNLAQHIMTNSEPFFLWRECVIQRLKIFFPFNDNDPLGDVVPREVFDPKYNFNPGLTESLIQEFLNKLDFNSNRFLNSPKKMLTLGFKDTPYQFGIKVDRFNRNDY